MTTRYAIVFRGPREGQDDSLFVMADEAGNVHTGETETDALSPLMGRYSDAMRSSATMGSGAILHLVQFRPRAAAFDSAGDLLDRIVGSREAFVYRLSGEGGGLTGIPCRGPGAEEAYGLARGVTTP